jgi:uncharacterized protein YyaL (SSP411 family)
VVGAGHSIVLPYLMVNPIQGGTYYQPEQWIELLNNLAYKYEKSPKEVERFAENLTKGIQQDELVTVPKVGIQFSQVTLDSLVNNWKPFLDTVEGGNLQEIKFPLPNNPRIYAAIRPTTIKIRR